MEVKIGVQNASREITLDTDAATDEITTLVSDAITKGGLLELTDNRGRKVLVPVERLAYVEVGAPLAGQVGFRG